MTTQSLWNLEVWWDREFSKKLATLYHFSIVAVFFILLYIHMKKLLTLWLLLLWAATLAWCNSWSSEPYGIDAPTDNLLSYSDVALASAQEKWDTTVLFFWATRCPGCVAFEKNITENADLIPEGVTFMAADFDADTALKETYNVTKKHTTIYLDASWEVIKSNTGKEYTIDDMIEQLGTL